MGEIFTEINVLESSESLNDEKFNQTVEQLHSFYHTFINGIFNYNKFNERFMDNLIVYSKDGNLVSSIGFDFFEFNKKIASIFDIEVSKKTRQEEFNEKLREKIEELKTIKDVDTLKEKFPLIYKDYADGVELDKKIDTLECFGDDADKLKAHKLKKYYYNCGLRYVFSYFMEEQIKFYTNILNKRTDFINRIRSNRISLSINDSFKTKEFELLVAYKYLSDLINTEDEEKKENITKLLSSYVENNKENVTLEDGKSFDKFVIDFRNYLLNVSKESSCLLRWEILPSGLDEKPHEVIETRTLTKRKEIDKYIKANIRKKNFFEKSGYIAKAKGLALNEGYTAFFYPNGEILIEKIGTEENVVSSFGNAIYSMNAYNFLALSPKDKTTLRKKDAVRIIVHHKNWEKEAQEIIDREGSEELLKSQQELIMKLKKKD